MDDSKLLNERNLTATQPHMFYRQLRAKDLSNIHKWGLECEPTLRHTHPYTHTHIHKHLHTHLHTVTTSPSGFRNPLPFFHNLTLLLHDCNQPAATLNP